MCFSRYPLYKVFFNKQLQKCKFTTWKRPKNLSGRNIVKIKDLFQKSHENFPKHVQLVQKYIWVVQTCVQVLEKTLYMYIYIHVQVVQT